MLYALFSLFSPYKQAEPFTPSQDQRTTFTSSEADSLPFSAILPPATTALSAVPIFDHTGDLALYLVVGTTQRHFTYVRFCSSISLPSLFSSLNFLHEQGSQEEEFIGGVGSIVLGSLLQSKILAADNAKLAFVRPSLSHVDSFLN
jgi:hypothetical protein